MGEFGISQPVPRTEDPRLLKGAGRFADDVQLSGMVHGYVLRSPHAHARIKSIDTQAAKAAPGVLEVLTGADYQAAGHGNMPPPMPPIRNTEGIEIFGTPHGALATDRVRYVGDIVAFVVAGTLAQAKDSAELIDVVYEPLPANTATAGARDADTPAIWDERPDNLCLVHEEGDKAATEAAFAKADHIHRQRFHINRVLANTIEPRGCVADYDAGENFCTIHMTTQGGFGSRRMLAAGIFKEPEANFRVIPGDVGGSFGMKGGGYQENILAVWASKRLGRPVKWIADRAEAMLSDTHGRDNVTEAALALDANGRFLALRVATTGGIGAYTSPLAAGPLSNNLGTLAGVYTLGAAYVRVEGVFTNNTPTAPYRGAGRPEAGYVIERLVDGAARQLGIDGVELRRRNLIGADAFPYKTALTFTYDSGDFEKLLDAAVDNADYAGFAARRTEARKRGKLRGMGLSYTIDRAAPPGMEHAEIRFDMDGTAKLYVGTTNNGQGHETIYTQLICDRFGLTPDRVRIVEGDTGLMAHGQGTGGSRVSSMGMSALHLAAGKLTDKAKKIAAQVLEAAEGDLEFTDGLFTVAGTDKSLDFIDVVRIAFSPRDLPAGMEPGLYESGTYRSTVTNYPNGCHICEVEVDPETGAAELVRYVVVDDVGTVLNPLLMKGQIHGGIAQGAGQILMEDMAYDAETGQVLSGSLMDYAMPRADDFCPIEVSTIPVPTPTNPLGVKGAGEAGTVGAMPAVANALIDALAEFGVTNIDLPATPERLWRLMRDGKTG